MKAALVLLVRDINVALEPFGKKRKKEQLAVLKINILDVKSYFLARANWINLCGLSALVCACG